jgi:DNA polymerase III epsilon subunit-like protein
MGLRWTIVDTETDGLWAPIHVVEIAAQIMEDWQPCGEPFQVFLNHNVYIPAEVVAVHGYTREFLRKHGRPPAEAHEAFREYVRGCPIVAHNLSFDWDRVLLPEWERLGIPAIGQRGFCTLLLARRLLVETASHRLDALKHQFGLGEERSHRALADVKTVVRLFGDLLRPRLEFLNLASFEAWQEFSRRTPVSECHRLLSKERNGEAAHPMRR